MVHAAIIDRHHATLRRLLALMLVYIGLADDTGQAMRFITGTADAQDAGVGGDSAAVRAFHRLCDPATVSRRVHTMVRHILLPAEAATRRLIVVLAADLPSPALRAWELKRGSRVTGAPKPVVLPRTHVAGVMAPLFVLPAPSPRPLSTAPKLPVRLPRFALLDPRKRSRSRHYAVAECQPRISLTGGEREPLAIRLPPTPYDFLPDQRLMRRICALAGALDDLPKEARRFARWRALRDYRLTLPLAGRGAPEARGGPRERFSALHPLRVGRPPGAPPLWLPRHRWSEAQDVVHETHGLA